MKSKPLHIIAFLLNIVILPGFGNLLVGKHVEGILQMLTALIGFGVILFLKPLGIVIVAAALVWAIIVGIRTLKDVQPATGQF